LIGFILLVGFAYELKDLRTYELNSFPTSQLPSFPASQLSGILLSHFGSPISDIIFTPP
jgi:hypothetical protein